MIIKYIVTKSMFILAILNRIHGILVNIVILVKLNGTLEMKNKQNVTLETSITKK